MTKFVLVACLLSDCYVIRDGLTFDDCERKARLGIVTIHTIDGPISAAGYRLSCKLEKLFQ